MTKAYETEEIALPSQVTHIKVLIRPVVNSNQSNLMAVAEVHFLDDEGFVVMKAKGFRIAEKVYPNGDRRTAVDFPTYVTGGRYYKSFVAENKTEFYYFLTSQIVHAYEYCGKI